MKNSTILFVFGLLGLSGVGVYLYLKNKKAPTTPTTPTSGSTPPSSATPTNPTTSGSNSVSNSSLGLTTTTTSGTDEQKNYLEAKELARILLLINSRVFDNEYKLLMTKYGYKPNDYGFIVAYKLVGNKILTKRINALGYKVLPNFDIEKM
jgi:hypothetical protein